MDKSLVEKEMQHIIGVQAAGLCIYNDNLVKELKGVNAVDSLASMKQMRFHA
jgi:hypothetical protein